jgi:hypothetical protein
MLNRAIFLSIAASTLCSAQQAQLCGTWKLDVIQSNFENIPAPREGTLKVLSCQTNSFEWTMTGVDSQGRGFSESYSGAIDGSPHPIRLMMGNVPATYTWDGDRLLLNASNSQQRLQEITILSQGGDTMLIDGTLNGGLAPQHYVRVYQRVIVPAGQ